MVSILLISSYSCESNLGDKDDLQDTQIFEKNETPTRIPTLVPVIDDIPSTVEPLILEKDDTSNEVCPCDVKSAITSSKSTNIDYTPLNKIKNTAAIADIKTFMEQLFPNKDS